MIAINERRVGVLRQLRSLLEFTRDIDRNQDDWLFANEKGRIFYIFDENVLECFINPVPHYVKVFFPRAREQSAESQICSQAALITSEYLVTKLLPGESEKRIYLTDWHFEELDNRITTLVRQAQEFFLSGEGTNSAARFFRRCDVSALSSLDNADGLTKRDYEQLVQQLPTDNDATLSRFLFARNAAAFLAQENPLTQAQLLNRLISSEIASSLAPLSGHPHLQDLSEEDAKQIRKDTREWRGRLEEEFLVKLMPILPHITLEDLRSALSAMRVGNASQRRTVHSRLATLHGRIKEGAWVPPSRWEGASLDDQTVLSALEKRYGRSMGSLHNDAKSLAYVLWAAKQRAGKGQRFAFITGDRVMFDTYRRWYIRQPEGEPFILRRIAQYAPIINLGDAPTDVVGQSKFFSQIRGGVETALLAFNLAGHIGQSKHIKSREHFALMLLELKDAQDLAETVPLLKFVSRLDDTWVTNNGDAFDEVVDRWAEVERFSIGVNYDLIYNRYNGICEGGLALQLSDKQSLPEVYAEYLGKILREICEGSAMIFFPFAEEFIRLAISTEESASEDYQARVPIAIHLFIPGKNALSVTLDNLLGQWRDKKTLSDFLDARSNTALPDNPALVFAIAAAVALRSNRWQDAERFSDVAARKMLILSDVEIGQEDAEYLYLRAVAKRFTMGNLAPWLSGASDDLWKRSLSMIVKTLARCEEHHRGRNELFRMLRAVSERAAARLFYAAWVVMTPDDEIVVRKIDYKEGITQLGHAIKELRVCAEQAPGCLSRLGHEEIRDRLLPRIERQFMTNLASAQALVHLFRKRDSREAPMPAEICLSVDEVKRIADWISQSARSQEWLPHPAAQADHLAFYALELGEQDALAGLTKLANDSASHPLAIDRELLLAFDRVARGGHPHDHSYR